MPAKPKAYVVRAYFTEVDSGHLFGPFLKREQAEACALMLAARPGVISAVIEEDE